MKSIRMTRAKTGLAAGVLVLAGMGTTVVTATPAAAVSWCNSTNTSSKNFIEWRGEARIPVYRSGSTTTRTCQMSKGSTGSHVKALQTSLNECYGENLDPDGIFGNATYWALVRAQREEKIGADGIYGPETRDALGWYYKPVTPGYDECSRL
ncbi:peptidoglycan-binding protein [Streptomyces sp. NPDC059906]|uniref:peptidoglycan-binding domain-containing protein n=1 Tax=Streptomyces sp. NPDC059906 TaxID=3346997 RepID=UPI00365B8275